MGTSTFTRFAIAILLVGLLIAAWMVVQGAGEAFGHGIREYLQP